MNLKGLWSAGCTVVLPSLRLLRQRINSRCVGQRYRLSGLLSSPHSTHKFCSRLRALSGLWSFFSLVGLSDISQLLVVDNVGSGDEKSQVRPGWERQGQYRPSTGVYIREWQLSLLVSEHMVEHASLHVMNCCEYEPSWCCIYVVRWLLELLW